MDAAVSISQRVQVDKGERNRSRARHRIRPARAQFKVPDGIEHASHQLLGGSDVVDDLGTKAVLAHEHRRAPNTEPQRLLPQHRLLQRQQAFRRHRIIHAAAELADGGSKPLHPGRLVGLVLNGETGA